jgi:hypothetical protein
VVGTIVYNDPSTTISIPFAVYYQNDGSPGAPTHCFFSAQATRATG